MPNLPVELLSLRYNPSCTKVRRNSMSLKKAKIAAAFPKPFTCRMKTRRKAKVYLQHFTTRHTNMKVDIDHTNTFWFQPFSGPFRKDGYVFTKKDYLRTGEYRLDQTAIRIEMPEHGVEWEGTIRDLAARLRSEPPPPVPAPPLRLPGKQLILFEPCTT